MPNEKFLIPDNFEDRRYHPGAKELPYEYTGGVLRDVILENTTGLEVIWARTREETLHHLVDADFMAADKLSVEDLARARRLRWIHISSAGADHFFKRSSITVDELRRRGIMVTTSAGAGADVIAEQALCYMLMFSRNMLRAVRQHAQGVWQRYSASELKGHTLGIIGLGAIGRRVAHLAKAFEMVVIATKRDPSRHDRLVDEVLPASAFRELFTRADYLLLACPITDVTRRIVNTDTLRLMKPTAYLLNVARGECVDEPALVQALKTDIIAGYAADNHGYPVGSVTDENMEVLSPDSELWGLENVIITPNCAVAGGRRYINMAQLIAENHRLIKKGEEPRTRLVWNGEPV